MSIERYMWAVWCPFLAHFRRIQGIHAGLVARSLQETHSIQSLTHVLNHCLFVGCFYNIFLKILVMKEESTYL